MPTTQPRKRGRPRTGDNSVASDEAILETALMVFAELGYEGTSTRALTRQIGVSHGLINAKFGSKRKLWEAAVELGMRHLQEKIERVIHEQAPEGDVIDQLRAVFVSFLVATAEAPAILMLMNYEGARQTDRLDYICDRFFSGLTSEFGNLLEEGAKSGVLRDTPQATIFLVLAHGGGSLFTLLPLARKLGVASRRSKTTVFKQAEEIAELLIRGIQI